MLTTLQPRQFARLSAHYFAVACLIIGTGLAVQMAFFVGAYDAPQPCRASNAKLM